MGLILSTDNGGTFYSTTFTVTTRAQLVDAIKNAMTSAGWSATGSSGDWELTNPTHPNGYQGTVRIWDPGSGNYIRLGIKAPYNLTGDNPVELDYTVSGSWLISCSSFQVYAANLANFTTVMGTKALIMLPYSPSSWAAIGGTECILLCSGGRDQGWDDSNAFLQIFADGLHAGRGHGVVWPGWAVRAGPIATFKVMHDAGSVRWAKSVIHCEPILVAVRDNFSQPFIVGYAWDSFAAYQSSIALGTTWNYSGMTFTCMARGGTSVAYFFRTA